MAARLETASFRTIRLILSGLFLDIPGIASATGRDLRFVNHEAFFRSFLRGKSVDF